MFINLFIFHLTAFTTEKNETSVNKAKIGCAKGGHYPRFTWDNLVSLFDIQATLLRSPAIIIGP